MPAQQRAGVRCRALYLDPSLELSNVELLGQHVVDELPALEAFMRSR
jgi:hypothetical protein